RHGHYESPQGCDCETVVGGRSPGYRRTQVGPHLSGPQTGVPSPLPSRFDYAHNLARRITRSNNSRHHFQYHSQFWDGIFSKTQRPVLREVFRQLNDRMTRYDPLYLKIFPTTETRPHQRETLIEIYRNGKIAEAFQAFKKIYLEVVDQ